MVAQDPFVDMLDSDICFILCITAEDGKSGGCAKNVSYRFECSPKLATYQGVEKLVAKLNATPKEGGC